MPFNPDGTWRPFSDEEKKRLDESRITTFGPSTDEKKAARQSDGHNLNANFDTSSNSNDTTDSFSMGPTDINGNPMQTTNIASESPFTFNGQQPSLFHSLFNPDPGEFAARFPGFTNTMNTLTSPIRNFFNDTTAGQFTTNVGGQAGDVMTGTDYGAQHQIDLGDNLNQLSKYAGDALGLLANPSGVFENAGVGSAVNRTLENNPIAQGWIKALGSIGSNPNSIEDVTKAGLDFGSNAAKLGTGILGTEMLKGNNNADKSTLSAEFGSNWRAGTGQLIQNAGQIGQWLGADQTGKALDQYGQDMSNGYASDLGHPFQWSDMLDPRWYTTSLAQSLPSSLATMGAQVPAYMALTGLGTKLGMGAFGKSVLASVGSGALVAAPIESAMEAGQTYSQALQNGMTHDQAIAAANEDFLKNQALLSGTDSLETLATFAPKPVKGFFGNIANKMGNTASAAARIGADSILEGGQEAAQQAFQDQALGQPVQWDSNMKEQAAAGAIMGGLFGVVGHLANHAETIKNDTINRLPDDLKTQFNDVKEQAQQQGMSEEEATQIALDQVASTPEGQKVVQDVTNEVVQNQNEEQLASQPANADNIVNQPDLTVENPITPTQQQSAEPKPIDEKLYQKAVDFVTKNGNASASLVQRHLKIGFTAASRLIDRMEQEGIVGPFDGKNPRQVFAQQPEGQSQQVLQPQQPKQPKQSQIQVNPGDKIKLKNSSKEYDVIAVNSDGRIHLKTPEGKGLTVQSHAIAENLGPKVNQQGTTDSQLAQDNILESGNTNTSVEQNGSVQQATEGQSLPQELKGAKPRYNYGQKQFELHFASDTDKAFYIVRKFNSDPSKMSKQDADYMKFLKSKFPDMKDHEIRQEGERIADYIKGLAKNAEPGKLTVPEGARGKSIKEQFQSTNPANQPVNSTQQEQPKIEVSQPEQAKPEPSNVVNDKTKFDKARDKLEWSSKMADLARKRIDSRKNNLNSLPMNDLIDYAIIGMDKMLHGAVDFAEWSDSMIKEFGGNEKLRRYLRAIHAQSEDMVKLHEEGNLDEIYSMIEDTQGKDVADTVRQEMEGQQPSEPTQQEQPKALSKEQLQPILDDVVSQVKAVYGDQIEKIVLYGSYAKNTAKATSDIDVLVLTEKNINTISNRLKLEDMMKELTDKHGKEVHIVTEATEYYDNQSEEWLQGVKDYAVELYSKEQPKETPQESSSNELTPEQQAILDKTYTIKKTVHTQKGHDIWVVNPKDRLPSDEFNNLRRRMQSMGGRWNGYKINKGFIFNEDPTHKLLKDLGAEQNQSKGEQPNVEPPGQNGNGSLETKPSENVQRTGEKRPVNEGPNDVTGTSGESTSSNRGGSSQEVSSHTQDELSTESTTSEHDSSNGVGVREGSDSTSNGGGRTESTRKNESVPGRKNDNPRTDVGTAHDFVITNELDDLGGAKTKFKNNVAALRLLNDLETTGRFATLEDQQTLAKYVGWGGLANAFKDSDEHWNKEIGELKSLVKEGIITQQEYEDARMSTQYAHFTSKEIVQGIYQVLQNFGFHGGRVLEPSVGTGNFFGLMPGEMTSNSTRIGVEKDPLTGKIAKHLYQNATIHIKPFQDYKIADGWFDVAVGNPPFSSMSLNYGEKKSKQKLQLHNYFFVRSLDKIRDGGIVAFVTSAGTLNAKSSANIRQMMADRADFLGAIRLPGDAFKKNAGTEVTTDIIFFQKRPADQKPNHRGNFINTVESQYESKVDGKRMNDNEYFVSHPDMVLGQYAEDKLHPGRLGVKTDGRDFNKAFTEAIQKLPTSIYQETSNPVQEEQQQIVNTGNFNLNSLDEGGYGIKDGQIIQRVGDTLRPVSATGKTAERIKGMIPIRDAAKEVLRLQTEGASDAQLKAAQKKLNQVYDAYVKKNGYLNESANKSAFKDDVDGSSILRALENYEEQGTGKNKKITATKDAVFHERTIQVASRADKADTSEEALIISLFEKGKIDFEHMMKLSGKDKETIIKELTGTIFENPQGGWETKDEYLSGNVREKLRIAKEAAQKNPKYNLNVEALEAVQPDDLSADQITVQLGAPWVPAQDIEQFINEFLGINSGAKVIHTPLLGRWNIDKTRIPSNNTVNREEYGVYNPETGAGASAVDLIEDALNMKSPRIGTYDEEHKFHLDQESTQDAISKVQQIQEHFKDWIWSDEPRMVRLVQKYNNEYNSMRLREFNGELIYGDKESNKPIPGLNKKYKLRPHQKNGVWRVAQGGNTLLAHVVGAGKTLEMIVSGMEMRRLGLINKPMYVVPNHLLDQWEREFKEAYPGAKILKISNDSIPSVSVKKGEVREELKKSGSLTTGMKVSIEGDNKKYTIEGSTGDEIALKDTKGKKIFVKRSQITHVFNKMTDIEFQAKRRERQAERGAALNKIAMGNHDAILITHKTFEKLPVSPQLVQEHIQAQLNDLEIALKAAVDENGKNDRTVKQLEAAKEKLKESLKSNIDEEAKDIAVPFEMLGVDQLFVDEAHLFKNLKFHTKMTRLKGLPTQNSKRAEDMFLKTQWLSQQRGGKGVAFATGTPVANSMAEMYTMQRYLGMSDLRAHDLGHFDSWAALFGKSTTSIEMDATGGYKQVERFAEFNNVAELMTMFRDFADIQTADMLDLPRPKEVKYETVVAPMTEGQKIFLQTLMDRAQAIKNGIVPPSEDNWLKITGDGRKAALDLRLVANDILPYIPDNEREQARKEIMQFNPEGKVARAVNNIYEIWKETTGERLDKEGKPIDKLTQLVFLDLGTPKTKEEKENEEENTNPPEEENSEEEFSSVYEDIRRKIVEKGIPQEQVAFIHEAKTGPQKQKLFQKVKSGEVRVLIGSTEKMGAGMNVQDRLIALHHLDAPWRPADVEQREGRIVRQGNRNDTVHIFNYTTEGSFDALMWGILKKKAQFIAQVMNGSSDARSIEDVGEFVAGFAHVEAITTGDTTVIEKYEADQKVNELTSLKRAFDKKKNKMRSDIASIPGEIEYQKGKAKKYQEDAKRVIDTSGDKFAVTIEGKTYTDRKEAGDVLNKIYLERYDKLNHGEQEKIGTFAGFDLYLHKKITTNFSLQGAEVYPFAVNTDSPSGTVQRMSNSSDRADELLKFSTNKINELEKRLSELKKLIDEPFAKEQELKDAQKLQAELTKKLLEKNQDKQAVVDDTVDQTESSNRSLAMSAAVKQDGGTEKTLSPKAAKAIGDIFANRFGTVLRASKPSNPKARGDFNPFSFSGRVKKKENFNWRVIGHELAHAFYKEGYRGVPAEMEHVADVLYPTPIKNIKLKREEGFAEFFQLLIRDPQEAEKLAPQTVKDFEEYISNDKELSDAFNKVMTIVSNDLQGTPIQRAMGSISFIGQQKLDTNVGEEYKLGKWDRALFNTVDFTLPFRDMMEAMQDRQNWNGDNYDGVHLAKFAAMTGGAKERARYLFEHQPTDQLGRYIAKRSLKSIANEAMEKIEKALGKEGLKKFGMTDGKKSKAVGGYHVLSTLLATRLYQMREEKGGFTTNPMSKEVADGVLEQGKKLFGDDVMNLVEEYGTTLSHIVMDKLEKAGVITSELRHVIEDKYDGWYLPTYSATENKLIGGTVRGGKTSKNPVKRYKEQSGPVYDFLTATMLKLAEVEQAVEYKRLLDGLEKAMNIEGMGVFLQREKRPQIAIQLSGEQIIQQVHHWLDESVDEEGIADHAFKFFTSGSLKDIPNTDTVVMNRHGDSQTYMRLSKDVFAALMAMRPANQEGYIRWMAKLSSFFRYFNVTTAKFIWNQLWRDGFTAAITKQDPRSIILGTIRGASLALHKTDEAKKLYDQYVTSGAFLSNAEDLIQMMKRSSISDGLLETTAPGWKRTAKGVYHLVFGTPGKILHWQEQMQRLAEFESRMKVLAKEHGIDEKKLFDGSQPLTQEEMKKVEKILIDAGYAASEVTANFMLHGASEKFREYTSTVSFAHGSLQGMYREARMFANPTTRNKAVGRMFLYTVPLTIAAWMLMKSLTGEDDDTQSDTRDRYWLLPIGEMWGNPRFRIAIAKPHMFAITANFLERFLDWEWKNNPVTARKPLEEWWNPIENALLPPWNNQFVQTMIDLYSNKDYFGNPIIPDRESKNYPKELQYGPSTSELAKFAAHLGLSPRQVDYVIKNLLGDAGKLTLQAVDLINGKSLPSGTENWPVIGSLILGPGEGGSRIVEKFYADKKQSDTLIDSMKKWAQNYNNQKQLPIQQFNDQDVKLAYANPAMNAITTILGDLRKEMNDINTNSVKDHQYTPQEKYQANLKLRYLEKYAAGYLYGYTPKPVGAGTTITDSDISTFKGMLDREVNKKMVNERNRRGGASAVAQTIQQFIQLQAGK